MALPETISENVNQEKKYIREPIPDDVKARLDKECKVLIGFPHDKSSINMNFIDCLDLMNCYIGGEWAYNVKSGSSFINTLNGWIKHREKHFPYEVARNNIAKFAKTNNYTHVMMIDTDMSFPPDIIYRMLLHDKDIVSALYYSRHPRPAEEGSPNLMFMPAVFKSKDKTFHQYKEIKLYNGLIEMDNILVGTGCMLIKTGVFSKIKYPWFKFIIKYNIKEERAERVLGEDIYFCLKANAAGYKVCLDTDIISNHDASCIKLPYELNYENALNVQII